MGMFVITAFKPKPGKEADLDATVRDHLPLLRRLGLATDRTAHAMRADDGTVIEVFEWVSPEAVQTAHSHPDVQALWKRYEESSSYLTLASVPAFAQMFPHFAPIETGG